MNDDQADQSQPTKPFQFSVRGLLVFVGVVAVVCGVISLGIQAARQARQQEKSHVCYTNLKIIGFALHYYHGIYGCFPSAFIEDAHGTPLKSWRTAIPDFIERGDFGRQCNYNYSLPWNHPMNVKVSVSFDHFFACPLARNGFTNYVMVLGQERADGFEQGHRFEEHPDAIIVAEIDESDIYWTEPRDLTFEEMSVKINDRNRRNARKDHHPHGALAVYADGSTRFLDDLTDPEELRKLLDGYHADAPGVKVQWHLRNVHHEPEPD